MKEIRINDIPKRMPYISIVRGKLEDVLVTDPNDPNSRTLSDFMREDILNARESVHVDMYSVVPSKELEKFLKTVKEAQERNPKLDVRIVENLLPEQEENQKILEEKGIRAKLKAFRTSKFKALLKTHHAKIVIVDERTAFIGDQNIQDQPRVGGLESP